MNNRSIVAVLVAFVFAAAACGWRGEPRAAIDLAARFGDAERRPLGAGPDVLAVKTVAIGGESRRAILARAPTRVTWDLTLPNNAFVRTVVGLDESVWGKESDGVQFRIAISNAEGYRPLLVRRVNPRQVAGDRGWIPMTVDLSRYSGQHVHLILATDTVPTRYPDPRNDVAYWGSPAITLTR